MWEHAHAFTRFRHFYCIKHTHRLFKCLCFAHAFMQHQHFHQLFTDAHVRIQRRHRILEDHRNLFCTQFIKLLLR